MRFCFILQKMPTDIATHLRNEQSNEKVKSWWAEVAGLGSAVDRFTVHDAFLKVPSGQSIREFSKRSPGTMLDVVHGENSLENTGHLGGFPLYLGCFVIFLIFSDKGLSISSRLGPARMGLS